MRIKRPNFFRQHGSISSVSDLQEKVRGLLKDYRFDSVYFRGQADHAWGLRPTIARKHTYLGLQIETFDHTQELYLLNRFRRYARAHFEREVSEWEALLLARHHRLPVRLLDWTSNPLVGLYYACEEQSKLDIDGAIWAFVRCQHPHRFFLDISADKKGPFKTKGVKMIFAPYISPRIVAQGSNFTIQQYPGKELQTYDPSAFTPRNFDIERIEKWIVPQDSKVALLMELERFGLNERSLFPDLDGIVRGIVRSELIRKGTPSPSPTPPRKFQKSTPHG